RRETQRVEPSSTFHAPHSDTEHLPNSGTVAVAGSIARFLRPGLIEEYSVSMDGVRQDFIIERRPEGEGDLRLDLTVTGAKTEPMVNGVRLVLASSRRSVAYSRLRAIDAAGHELPARIECLPRSKLPIPNSESDIAITVNDMGAVYPVRIDPT